MTPLVRAGHDHDLGHCQIGCAVLVLGHAAAHLVRLGPFVAAALIALEIVACAVDGSAVDAFHTIFIRVGQILVGLDDRNKRKKSHHFELD